MARTLSANLNTESNSLIRNPAAQATAERWLPDWSTQVSALDGLYRHGHCAILYSEGASIGEDILFRARITDAGTLQVAVISGPDLHQPSTWEAKWVSSSGGWMPPLWTANTPGSMGGDIVCVLSEGGFRVFASQTTGNIRYEDFTSVGTPNGGNDVITTSPNNSIQMAAAFDDELFILEETLVEASNDAWQSDVYGAKIRRISFSGTWVEDPNPYLFHTHNRGNLLTDDGIGDTSVETETQWGFRPNGGLAALALDVDRVMIVFAGRFYWQNSYTIHTASLMSYHYHRNNGLWSFAWQNDEADYESDRQLWASGFLRGFQVEGISFISWVRMAEPIPDTQDNDAIAYERDKEAVYAKISPDGINIANRQYLGEDYEMCSGMIAALNTGGVKKIAAIGYRGVRLSPPCAIICDVPVEDTVDLALYSSNYTSSQGNDFSLTLTSPVENADVLEQTFLKEGDIVRLFFGNQSEQPQFAMGYINRTAPHLSLQSRINSASIVGRAELQLLNVRSEAIEDWFPLATYTMVPEIQEGSRPTTSFIEGREIVINHPTTATHAGTGWYLLQKPQWNNLWFAGVYDLPDVVYRNEGYPFALTGGGPIDLPEGVEGGPGSVAETYKLGTMFGDLVSMFMEPRVDLMIEGCFRFGDNRNANNFGFTTAYGTFTSLDVQRDNGLIPNILYRDDQNNVWNDVWQESVMAGLVFRSVQDPADTYGTGKKYMYCWEANSDLVVGSHLEDQAGRFWGYGRVFEQPDYGALPVGRNKLYIIMSDFDETDEDWESNDRYINKAVIETDAIGLTPGQPANLRLQVLGGTAYCFYRPHKQTGSSPHLWRFAFAYNTGHFGAGKAGFVTRGHNTILWDAFEPAEDRMRQYNNDVDTWDVECTDCTYDLTLKELLEKYAWQGHMPTEFRTIATGADDLEGDDHYPINVELNNVCVDLTISVSAAGEAGLYFRSSTDINYYDEGNSIGLVFNDTYKEGDNTVNNYAVYRKYTGDAEVPDERQYAPSAIPLKINTEYAVRVVIRNDLAIIYVERNYIGHFHMDHAPGLALGVFAVPPADITHEVTELHEIPENSLVDPNQRMWDAMMRTIGHRHISGVHRWNENLLISKFADADAEQGPELEDQIVDAQQSDSDTFYNVVEVQAAEDYCIYVHKETLSEGRRYILISQPNLMTIEAASIEAQYTVKKYMENKRQLSLVLPPDLRIEPEDLVTVYIDKFNINDDNYVNKIDTQFSLQNRQAQQVLTIRRKYIV